MRRDWLRSVWRGADESPEPWDEELAPPRSRRRGSGRDGRRSQEFRRVVLTTVVVLLLALVGASIVVLGGDDGKQSAKVSAAETTASTSAGGDLTAFLPTPVTAVSLGGQVVIPDPATTLPTQPGATQPADTVAQPATTAPDTTSPPTTQPTTAPPTTPPTTQPTTQPFTYVRPHQATGLFTNGQGSAACPAPVPPERQGQFVLSTPTPGVLSIQEQGAAATASGPIDPSGTFHFVRSEATGENYDGQASSSRATASYLQDAGNGCTITYDVVFTFT